MKKSSYHILSLARFLAFVLGICVMMIQPAIQSFAYLDKQDFKLVDIDTEKDFNEKENQEDDSKDEKVELQLSSSNCNNNMFIKKPSILGREHIKWNFSPEIHIPPPEHV